MWQRKFLDTIFFPTLDRYDVRTVLHGGDYGDRRKYINFATARFIEDAYRTPLRQRGITEHVLIGNHDCFLRDSTAINSVLERFDVHDFVLEPLLKLDEGVDDLELHFVEVLLQIGVLAVFEKKLLFRQLKLSRHVSLAAEVLVYHRAVGLH